MSMVFPGVADVMASPLRPVSMLMRLDFPTLERPMKAYSGNVPPGHFLTVCIADDEFGACYLHFITCFFVVSSCKGSTYFKKSPSVMRNSLCFWRGQAAFRSYNFKRT